MRKNILTIINGVVLFLGLLFLGTVHGEIISDFNDGVSDWGIENNRIGNAVFVESGGQLTITGTLPATQGNLANSIASCGWAFNHSIRDGQTLEYRVELIETSRGDVSAGLEYNTQEQGLYALAMNEEGMWLEKVSYGSGLIFTRFFQERAPLKTSNVTLSLALTGVGDSVRITAQVLDNANSYAVLLERTVMDTPGVDPTVDPNEVPGVTNLQPDPGVPFFNGVSMFLDLVQISDGNQPEARVVYDNFTYEYRSAVVLDITKSVRLSWPTFSTTFVLEGAPSVDGPWTQVAEPVFQIDRMNYVTIPVATEEGMKAFRLQEVTDP